MDVESILSSEDSNSEFSRFNSEDITNENDSYVPDSDPDSDIAVSSVNSSGLSDFRGEDGEDGNDFNDNGQDEEIQPEWTQNFRDVQVDDFT